MRLLESIEFYGEERRIVSGAMSTSLSSYEATELSRSVVSPLCSVIPVLLSEDLGDAPRSFLYPGSGVGREWPLSLLTFGVHG